MNTENSASWQAAQIIAGVLTPHDAQRDQEFWIRKLPALIDVPSAKAIIQERQYFFDDDRTRANALALMMMVDFGWQLIRDLGGITSKAAAANFRTTLHWSNDAHDMIDHIEWVYEIHSALRHPTSNFPKYNWLLNQPWPEPESERLLQASAAVCSILLCVDVKFNPDNGFEGEVAEKQTLAAKALSHWEAIALKQREAAQ